MNLLSRPSPPENNIFTFRHRQYRYVEGILRQSVSYLSSKFGDYLQLRGLDRDDGYTRAYNGIYQSEMRTFRLNVFNSIEGEEYRYEIMIPKLVDGNYFIIYGTHYVPEIFLIHFPISLIPGHFVKIYGLYNSMLLRFTGKVSVGGETVNLKSFLRFVLGEHDLIDRFLETFRCPSETEEDEESFANSLEQKFGTPINEVSQNIYNLIFDPYTVDLYQACYGRNFNDLSELLIFVLSLATEEYGREILKRRRIAWLDVLLREFLTRCGIMAGSLMKGTYLVPRIKKDICLKNMRLFHYDSANLFSAHAISRITRLDRLASKDISHEFQGIFCPVSMSNHEVGKVVWISPEVVVDDFGVIMENDNMNITH